MTRRHRTSRPYWMALALAVLPAGAAVLPAAAQDAAPAPAAGMDALRAAAVAAYNARDWKAAAEAADAYDAELTKSGLPRAGNDFALVAFVGGHARFELWRLSPQTFRWDFRKDVLGTMNASLAILQDDLFFKHNVLGSAYFEKAREGKFRDLELENEAAWHMWRALLARVEDLGDAPRDGEEYTTFAKYLLQYVARSFEMARWSKSPDVYLVRVREACRLGFGTKFEDRFAQLYQVVGFDDGNVRAGVLWQAGLDLMATEGSRASDVLDLFREAAEVAKGPRERAEIYRQIADYSSRQDGHEYKVQAVEYGRMAFRLNPRSKDIQAQFGTSLHVLSYAAYNAGKFDEALRAAQEATSFEWEGDEVGLFDLARAEANFGDKINALRHAEAAYQKALQRYSGAELAPFRQNYANILRQFGMAKKASLVEAERS